MTETSSAVDIDDFDPHALAEQDFLDEVHSFQFWFDSIEGYLTDRPYGRLETTDEEPLDDDRRDRLITTLCNYSVGETAALEGAAGLVQLAPDRNSKIFMATQVADEARHLEVFLHRLRELGVADPESEIERRAQPALVEFKGTLLELVAGGDWQAAVFAQNVILETMEYTVFRLHAANADAVTRDVLAGVIADERRHAGFGENDLGRSLAYDPAGRARLREIRSQLDPMVLGVFESALDDVGAPTEERNRLAGEYLDTVERLGLT
jgi:1,2-phenylacetyl-CoA epoxidase catalytic subunit